MSRTTPETATTHATGTHGTRTAPTGRRRPGRLRSSLAVAAATAAVAAGTVVVGAAPASAAELCGQYDSASVNGGAYIVQNDHWNPDSTGAQCVDPRDGGFTLTSADGSVTTNGAPKSYPSIYAGCHYTNCSSGFTPTRAGDLGSARTTVSITEPSDPAAQFDASYDIWFDTTANPSGQNDGTEIMIWLDHRGDPQPIGSVTGHTTIGGVDYTVWQGHGHGAQDWNVISFVADSPQSSADVRIADFAQESISRGSTQPGWYMTSVQFGFEPWVDGAGLGVNGFSYSS